MRLSHRLLTRTAAVLALAGALAGIPTAAQAVFSSTARATVSASTMTLAAPSPALMVVVASCEKFQGTKRYLEIDVVGFGAVAEANFHTLTVTDPAGNIDYQGDLSATAGRSFAPGKSDKGDWTYEIRGEYRVPGTTNIWTGKKLTGTVTCK